VTLLSLLTVLLSLISLFMHIRN